MNPEQEKLVIEVVLEILKPLAERYRLANKPDFEKRIKAKIKILQDGK